MIDYVPFFLRARILESLCRMHTVGLPFQSLLSQQCSRELLLPTRFPVLPTHLICVAPWLSANQWPERNAIK